MREFYGPTVSLAVFQYSNSSCSPVHSHAAGHSLASCSEREGPIQAFCLGETMAGGLDMKISSRVHRQSPKGVLHNLLKWPKGRQISDVDRSVTAVNRFGNTCPVSPLEFAIALSGHGPCTPTLCK